MPRGLESLLVAAAFYPMSLSSICLDSTKFIFEKKKSKEKLELWTEVHNPTYSAD